MAVASVLSLATQGLSAGAVTPRITDHVDEARRVTLPGNRSMLARAEFDQGEASPSTQLTHIRLVLSRSREQEAALDKYSGELQDKSSENYHKWLTPEQFGKLYGPADSDTAAIVAWLESHGLKLEEVSTGRTNIAFSGTVAQVEETFHTQIHSFQARGQQFYSNTSNPSIPAALASVISGVAHLNTLRPVSHRIAGRPGMYDKESGRLVPAPNSGLKGPSADLTTGSGSSASLYVAPADAATIYDTPNTTLNANYTSGTSYTGAGVTIGIGGNAAIQASTVVAYRTRFLGSSFATAPTITNVDGVGANGDTDEAYLDNELAGGMAPGATIHFYTANDLFTAINQAIADNTVDIFSLSFGECEHYLATADNSLLNSTWHQAFTQGIAVTVSTGDNGSAACDNTEDNNGNNITDAVVGLQVSGFASTPYNVAVGGTDFYALPGAFTTYAPPGGASSTLYRSATKYIPESTWNDSTQVDTTISANVPFTGTDSSGDPFGNIVAGSGGASSCSTNKDVDNSNGTVTLGACTSGYAKPVWQRGIGVPPDGVRDLPDISLMAGNGADAASWLVCADDTGQNGSGVTVTANCTTQSDGNFYFEGFGGTSTSAPAFAGILALVQQKTGSRLGLAAKELYDLYNGTHASAVFHDVTVGNISVACTSGTPNCVKDAAGYYFESGYETTAGYDQATGLGSVDAAQLITYWGSAIGSATATVAVTPSKSTVTNLQAFTVAAVVTGGSGTPTGTVTLTSGTYTSGAQTLTAGAYTFSIAAGALAAGTDTLTVTYSGDVNYASTTGTATITVEAPAVSLSPGALTFTATLVGSSAATQPVTLKNTGNGDLNISSISITGANVSSFSQTNTCTATLTASSSCVITVSFSPKAPGALTASVGVTDNATGSPQTVSLTGTGTSPTPAVSLTPTSLTFPSTTEGTAAATQAITVKNTGTAPLIISGVSITGTNATSFTQTSPSCTTVAVSGTCTITVTFQPTTFSLPNASLTASVSIADNASGSPQTVSLTGTATEIGTYALTASTPTAVAPGSPGSATITATPSGGYTGVITLKCSVTPITGGTDVPTCSAGSPITVTAGVMTGTVTVNTTAPSTLARKGPGGSAQLKTKGWLGAGGAALACVLLLGIPARKRYWKSLLGVLIFIAALGALSGCGGGGGGTVTQKDPGTTAGAYTVTVTGTDAAQVSAPPTTFTLTVN